VVSRQNADVADTLQLTDFAMATIFVFPYMGYTYNSPNLSWLGTDTISGLSDRM